MTENHETPIVKRSMKNEAYSLLEELELALNERCFMTLQPGDVIATGTCAAVGFYAKPEKRLLKPGDVIEAEIEALGVLRNSVVSAQ